MAKSARNAGAREDPLDERIVDAAVALAEEVGWENVRLRTVAERLDRPLATIAARCRDSDAAAAAWFARARQAMPAPPPEDFAALPARDRLEVVLRRGFEAASRHKRMKLRDAAGCDTHAFLHARLTQDDRLPALAFGPEPKSGGFAAQPHGRVPV